MLKKKNKNRKSNDNKSQNDIEMRSNPSIISHTPEIQSFYYKKMYVKKKVERKP